MSRWRGNTPLKRISMPRVGCSFSVGPETPHEIYAQWQLGNKQCERTISDKLVPPLHGMKKFILGRIVDAAHVASDSEKMHRKEGRVEEHVRQEKVHFPEPFMEESTEHF